VMISPGFLTENVNVKDFKNSESIYHQKRHKPVFLVEMSRFPKRQSFLNNRPYQNNRKQKSEKPESES